MSRYINTETVVRYQRLEEVDMRPVQILHYPTPFFPVLEKDVIAEFTHIRHTWKLGDKFYKLAAKYYDDATSWWIIALYNSRPTEAHVRVGDVILIPQPAGLVLARYGY
jgi:nucleoid-associated protein YgaU